MFTGLISGIGRLRAASPAGDGSDARFVIALPQGNADWADGRRIAAGASIACSGCCLTVIDRGADFFAVEVSAETLRLTTLGGWRPGQAVNLEASLKLGDALGGHLVSGHVDGLAAVAGMAPENGSTRWRFRLPGGLAGFVAPKGSIAVNGVSLTVNAVQDEARDAPERGCEFGVNVIAHTAAHTDFSELRTGDEVNIEIDMLARYVARLQGFAELNR